MMEETEYGKQENWYGACYEVAIDYSYLASDETLSMLAQHLWLAPGLRGPFAGPYAPKPLAMEPIAYPTAWLLEDSSTQYGMIEVQDDLFVGCKLHFARADWFFLCIPTGMLGLLYSIAYPLALKGKQYWMNVVNRILIDIAQHAYIAVPFDFAVIGEDAGAFYPVARDVTAASLEHGGCLISSALFERVQPDTDWERLPSGLLWRDRQE